MKHALAIIFLVACGAPALALAHPAPPPLRDKADRAKFVVVCRAENPREDTGGRGSTDLVVTRVIKADPAVKVGDRIQIKYFLAVPDPKKPPHFLAFGNVDKGLPHIYTVTDATPALLDYFEGSMKIDAKDRVKLMRYAFAFLEHKEDVISEDARKTFRWAKDRDRREAGRHVCAEKLREWLMAEETLMGSRGLYARLLACCGGKDDAAFLRKVIDDRLKDSQGFAYMEGLLVAYTELDPKAGWAFTRELAKDADGWVSTRELEKNTFSVPFVRYATLQAVRHFRTERRDVVSLDDIRDVIGLMLNQGDTSAIEDLRKWRDWSFTDKVLGLWDKKGFKESYAWRDVVKYALQCPDPKAVKFIAELRKTDALLVAALEEELKEAEAEEKLTEKKGEQKPTAREDILLADFEGDTYGAGWKTTGTAFGKGPAKGTLPGQMAVTGFLGNGLVNSFLGGDDSTGTLTSPAFKIERKYLNFLIGGGKHPEKACVNLLVGGKVLRTATGPNDKPGGTEHLDWNTWDVGEFEGKDAVLQFVDEQKGGWGHINADHFVLSDKKKQAEYITQDFHKVDKRYLHLPVKTGAPMRRMQIVVREERDGGPDRSVLVDKVVREFDIELAEGKPDYWAFADVSAFKGKHLGVKTMLPADSKALDALKLADDVPDAEKLYREKHRPLFHFTSRFGWLNDPNGLVYHDNEWHLFYQHNPFGVNWGNMHWGHAVSSDLVRWKEEGIGLYPRKYGDWAFSGSAVVDKDNTSGWGTKEKPPLVLAYTSTGRGECIAYSTDKGRTWTEYDKNPVVKHQGRDPKLVWYEKGKHWVMAVYDEYEKKQWIAFYTSPDLKEWKFASRIEGFFECPDLFELPVMVGVISKEAKGTKWILYAADGKYLIGDFDGKEFKSDVKEKIQIWHGRFYAAQTFSNDPPPPYKPVITELSNLPRKVQIGWANGVTFPGMPFNQQMTLPVQLGIVADDDKDPPRLRALPVPELATLRDGEPALNIGDGTQLKLKEARTLVGDLDGFEAWVAVDLGKADGFTLDLRGTKLKYDAKKQTFTCKDVTAPAKLYDGKLSVTVFVDRGSIEVFAEGGHSVMSIAAIPDEKNRKLEFVPEGGEVIVRHAVVHRMKSAWEK